jgi:hypothetical protein
MMRRLVCIALCLALAISCSIKEERTDCPCRLVLDFSNIDTVLVKSLDVLATCGGKIVFRDSIYAGDFEREYMRDVPHGDVRINVWCVGEERIDDEQGVVIPYGCECPVLYMKSFVADTRGEQCREIVQVHKNYCKLTVLVEGVDEPLYSLTCKGNVDGYTLDGLPSKGDFACVAYPGDNGDLQAGLPRQMDASLALEVDDGTSFLKTFALGEYIIKGGYDWAAAELEDLTITLDYQATYIKITVSGWDKEYFYNIVL